MRKLSPANTGSRLRFLSVLLLLLATGGWAQDLAWIRQMGGTNQDFGSGVAVDSEGNAYVFGTFHMSARVGDIILNGTNQPAPFIAKVTPQGDVVWANSFGETWATRIGGVAIDLAGFVYETGSFVDEADFGTNHLASAGDGSRDDVFLAKYDLNGTLIWAKRYGSSEVERCGGLFVDDSGNVFLSGFYGRYGAVLGNISLPGTGLAHVWVAKLNGAGEIQWASSASSEIWLYSQPQVTADSQGNVYVAGGFSRSLSFPTGTNIVASSNVTENVRLEGLSGDRWTMFLAKYDSSGRCLWARSGGGPAVDLAVDDEGHVYVTGKLQQSFGQPYSGMFDNVLVTGNNDCFLAKFDAAGGLLWAKNEGGTSMVLAENGDVYVSQDLLMTRTFGDRTFNALGYLDIFVGRYDQAGNPVAAWQVGDLEGEQAGGVGVDRFGNIWVVGSSFHSSASSNYQLTNYGGWDAVVARLAQDGPLIVQQPQRLTLYRGSNAVLSVQVTNAVSAHFQWYRNGTPLADDSRISGATNETLVIRAADVSDEADYNVWVTADNGQVISSTARLRIEGLIKFIKAERGPFGSFLVTFTGTTGHLYDVEVSTNYLTWRFLTNGFCRDDTLTIGDFSGANSHQRFYRVVAH